MSSYTILTANLKIDYFYTSLNKRFNKRVIGYKDLIKEIKPDFIAFQECQETMNSSLSFLKDDYAYHRVLSGNKLSRQENVLFYLKRFDLIEKGSFWLSKTPNIKNSSFYFFESRNVTYIRLKDKLTNNKLFIACTHLDFSNPYIRKLQLNVLNKQLNNYLDNDVLLILGDFNCTNKSKEIKYFLDNSPIKLIDTVKDINVPSIDFFTLLPKHSGPIDHIFVNEGIKVDSCKIHSNKKQDIVFSDHHPISCKITLD